MPRTVHLAFLALAASSVVAGCAARPVAAAPTATRGGVRFMFSHPDARTVALSGSFNGWSTSSHMLSRERGDGPWVITVSLPPGEHAFMYVVDDMEWITPPLADDYVDDGFGARNGIVVVASTRR